jgi:class 3 adenylate cyclase/ribosomal protein L40E
MRCPGCQAENPEHARFCLSCGQKLVEVCSNCGTQLPAGARFCLECGTAVHAGSAEAIQQESSAAFAQAAQRLMPRAFADRLLATRGQVTHERRLVTILFSDVKGSAAMAEQLDPEDVMDIMSGAFKFLIEPIYNYEGTLARLMGDAILAFFGAPIAHEDDPERAIRAGLDIVQGARQYAAKLQQERGISGFNVRVGINTGLVVVGEVGSDLRLEYTAMGDAVNLAARMEANAPPGGILISHDTYRHVRGVFTVRPQEPLIVRGKPEPVLTYLVEAAKARPWRKDVRGVEGIETRLVGRDVELLALQTAFLDAVDEAETHVVTIVGEAGVGKSRLMDEFDIWSELRPETFWFFKGRAASTAQTVPYHLMRDMFAYRFNILESDNAATVLTKFREGMAAILEPDRADLVGQLVGFDMQAAGSEAVQALLGSPNFRQLASAYFVQYARGLLAQYPMLILLEDLQWADDSSLDLVAQLVAEIPDDALFVVGAARPALSERRPYWGEGQAAYLRLELKPLSKRATRALVAEVLQKVP